MTKTPLKRFALIAYEDRQENEVGLSLLALSAFQHFPECDVHLFNSSPTETFKKFCQQEAINLHTKNLFSLSGWNVKPELLQWGLKQGYERVFFCDADIIFAKALPNKILNCQTRDVIIAENPPSSHDATSLRTEGWGLTLGRSFIRDPTACFFGVTQEHLALLNDWIKVLSSGEYLEIQSKHRDNRPYHARGSDDVLVSLLASEQHAHIPIQFLSSTKDIAQCISAVDFSLSLRFRSALNIHPVLVHEMGKKPWQDSHPYPENSYYTRLARTYRQQLPLGQKWLETNQKLSIWKNLFINKPGVSTLPEYMQERIARIGLRSLIKYLMYRARGGR
jgi:hypothetical protein